MLMISGDVAQLELVGSLQGQVVRNVFHYRIDHTEGGAVNIASVIPLWFIDFDTMVLPSLHQTMLYNQVLGKNLMNPLQIYDESVTASGDGLGQCLPVHDTMSVKLIRTSGVTRNGRKSYSGVDEGNTQDGDLLTGQGFIDDIEDFHRDTKTYALPATPSITVDFVPVIVGRTKDANDVYQLDVTKINVIRDAAVSLRVRTQNTRKF